MQWPGKCSRIRHSWFHPPYLGATLLLRTKSKNGMSSTNPVHQIRFIFAEMLANCLPSSAFPQSSWVCSVCRYMVALANFESMHRARCPSTQLEVSIGGMQSRCPGMCVICWRKRASTRRKPATTDCVCVCAEHKNEWKYCCMFRCCCSLCECVEDEGDAKCNNNWNELLIAHKYVYKIHKTKINIAIYTDGRDAFIGGIVYKRIQYKRVVFA